MERPGQDGSGVHLEMRSFRHCDPTTQATAEQRLPNPSLQRTEYGDRLNSISLNRAPRHGMCHWIGRASLRQSEEPCWSDCSPLSVSSEFVARPPRGGRWLGTGRGRYPAGGPARVCHRPGHGNTGCWLAPHDPAWASCLRSLVQDRQTGTGRVLSSSGAWSAYRTRGQEKPLRLQLPPGTRVA